MANQRRRGKSVVFEMLPSFHVPEEGDGIGTQSASRRWRSRVSREAVQEIVMVIVGLALVVWLFFGGSTPVEGSKDIKWAGRVVQQTTSNIIIPASAGSGNSRDGVKKAPGDKQGGLADNLLPAAADKPGKTSLIYQFLGNAPKLVLVTVLDDTQYPRDYCDKIVENRVEYANEHGFGVLIRYVSDYQKIVDETVNHCESWSRVALAREAMETFSDSEWFWYLDQDALIMEPQIDILKVLSPEQLESNMLRDTPIVRDSNDIRTSNQNSASSVSLVLERDERGLSSTSFLYRNVQLSKAWLELWLEPLYRNYHGFSSEVDALHHLMQWHNRFLLSTAVVPARLIASTVTPPASELHSELLYHDGDMVAVVTCEYKIESCKREFHKMWNARKRVSRPQQVQAGKQPEGQDPAQAKAQQRAQQQAQAQAEAKAQE